MSRVVLITGGSRGIGAAAARAAARDGWTVVLTYRSDETAAREVVTRITDAGGTCEAIRADVAQDADVHASFAFCKDRFGRLDGLVNNAGILPPAGRFETIDPERWERTFRINTMGTYRCCREAVRAMAPRFGGHGGTIVNLSSMAAVLGGAFEFTDYAASKGAVDTLTIGLARELGPDSIRVNGVRPGLIRTEIHGSAGDVDRVERLATGVPLGRAGTAEETAEAIVWLLSDASSYVTGSFITVSGGR